MSTEADTFQGGAAMEAGRALSDEQAEAMLAELSKHFHQPVMPVERYCEALRTWSQCIIDRDGYESPMGRAVLDVSLGIRKSNLLARLIYEGEELRTRECPVHKGRWSGISACEHGCGETGWIPNDWPDGAPRCTEHPDRPAVSRTVSINGSTDDCYECYCERWHRPRAAPLLPAETPDE